MLGIFSFEPKIKSYCWFTVGSLKFLKLQIGPDSSTSSLLACSTSLLTGAAPPAALGRLPGHQLLALASTRRAGPLHRFYPSRWPSFPLATPPRSRRRPPRHRRRGP